MTKSTLVQACKAVDGMKYRSMKLLAFFALLLIKQTAIETKVKAMSIDNTRQKKVPRFEITFIVEKPANLKLSRYGN